MARAKAILVDVDGTISLRGDRGIFDFSKAHETDTPNLPVIACIEAMANAGYEVVFCSGREAKYREQTMLFIRRHMPWLDFELYMRATGDTNRSDDDIKEEIYRGKIEDRFDIAFALDDRNRVVDRYREMGLTVFQVAPGNF